MCVYIREKETGLIGMLLQLWFTVSLTLVKQSRCVLLKDTSDSYCVYKVSDAVLARQELYTGLYVGIISQFTLLISYTYYVCVHLLSFSCNNWVKLNHAEPARAE